LCFISRIFKQHYVLSIQTDGAHVLVFVEKILDEKYNRNLMMMRVKIFSIF